MDEQKIVKIFTAKNAEHPNGRRPLGHLEEEREQGRNLERALGGLVNNQGMLRYHIERLTAKALSVFTPPSVCYSDQSHLESNHVYSSYEAVFDALGLDRHRGDFQPEQPYYYPPQAANGQHQSFFPQWAMLADPVDETMGMKIQNKEIRFEIGALHLMAAFKFEPVGGANGIMDDYDMVLSQCDLHNGSEAVSIETDSFAPDYDRAVIDEMLAIARAIVDDIEAGNDPAPHFERFMPLWRHLADRDHQAHAYYESGAEEEPPYTPFTPKPPQI